MSNVSQKTNDTPVQCISNFKHGQYYDVPVGIPFKLDASEYVAKEFHVSKGSCMMDKCDHCALEGLSRCKVMKCTDKRQDSTPVYFVPLVVTIGINVNTTVPISTAQYVRRRVIGG